MERKKPTSGEFYRHFKGRLYQVKMLARDSETQDWSVVYQEMYPPFQCWVRGLQEFMEPVDREKYPDCSQNDRFERVEPEELNGCEESDSREGWNGCEERNDREEDGKDEFFLKAIKSGQPERYLRDVMSNDQVAERGFLALLDAETFSEKRQIFMGLRNYLTPLLISNIAVALDIVLEDGNQEEQFESVLHCLEAFEHYEGGRLR